MEKKTETSRLTGLNKTLGALRTIGRSIKTTAKICFSAAKSETIWLLILALGTALFSSLTQWSFAHVIDLVVTLIKVGKGGVVASEHYMSDWSVMIAAVTFGALASGAAFLKLLRFTKTSHFSAKMRFEVDRLIRELRTSLDIGCIRGQEYEELKIRIQEQPLGWSAIEQFASILTGLSANLANLLIYGLALCYFNIWYAGALFVGVLARAVSEFYWGNQWWAFFDSEASYSRRRGVFASLFSNVYPLYDMKFFGKAEVADGHILKSQEASVKRKDKVIKGDAFWSIATEMITIFILIGVTVHAVYNSLIKQDVSLLVLTLTFSLQFVNNLKEVLFDLASTWKASRSVSAITEEFLRLQPLISPSGNKLHKFGRFELKDLSFSYPGSEQPVLKKVNLSFGVGTSLAIVGPSGGGKSTIASLLARQYDPTSGAILLDNIPLSDIAPREWVNYCLFMGQDFSLPHVTILEAICYGKWVLEGKVDRPEQKGIGLGVENIDMGLVRRACERANILHVIESKPNGFNSLIGTEQGGVELSKGERQRLALAARLMSERKLMFYDEPDASLDSTSKELVIKGILDTDATVILVVHNLRACEHCDLVAFVRDGQIIESGTHRELIALNGEYAEMYHKQVLEDERDTSMLELVST